MKDVTGKFNFLTLTMPKDMDVQQCKILSNGNSLLVVVTEDPKDEPVTDSMRKYKLVMEALKRECDHNEDMLHARLNEWYSTEEDVEVRSLVGNALQSLTNVRGLKKSGSDRAISVPLGLPSLVQEQKEVETGALSAGIVKESFALDMPIPVPVDRVFVMRLSATKLLIVLPHVESVVMRMGISIGAQPYARAPVFDTAGKLLAGPPRQYADLTAGMDFRLTAKTMVPLES